MARTYSSDRAKPKFRNILNPQVPSDLISRFDTLGPGDEVLLVLRVSTEPQRPHLANYEAFLRRVVKEKGAIVMGVISWVGNGTNPDWLKEAYERDPTREWILLTFCTNRYIRTLFGDFGDIPNNDDLMRLRAATSGFELMSYLDADATETKQGSRQKKLGQKASKKVGGAKRKRGPGYKKRRRKELLPKVLDMLDDYIAMPEIAKEVRMSVSSVFEWKKKYRPELCNFKSSGFLEDHSVDEQNETLENTL